MVRPAHLRRLTEKRESYFAVKDQRNYIYAREGNYSFIALSLLLFVITLVFGFNYFSLFHDLRLFLTGNLSLIEKADTLDLIQMSLVVIAIICLDIVLSLLISNTVSRLIGNARSFAIGTIDDVLDRGSGPLFFIVLAEEIFARLIPLGLLTLIFPSSLAFYILMLAGNLIWTLLHLANFTSREERSVLRVLPQFTGGIVLSYVFWKYGFLVTLFAHFLFDVVVLSSRKEKPVDRKFLVRSAFFAVVAVISGLTVYLSGWSVSTLIDLIAVDGRSINVASIPLGNLVLLFVLLDSVFEVIGSVLLLDNMNVSEQYQGLIMVLLNIPLYLGFIYFLNLLMLPFVDFTPVRALIITILLLVLRNTTSGSAMARNWMVDTPIILLQIIVLTYIGIWSVLVLVSVFALIYYVQRRFSEVVT